jgi:NHS family xanthosine MFS transporter
LITVGNYWFGTKDGVVLNFAVFFQLLASIIMPALIGIVIDGLMLRNYMDITYFSGLAIFIYPKLIALQFYWVIFLAMMFYMPTILSNSVAYNILKQ